MNKKIPSQQKNMQKKGPGCASRNKLKKSFYLIGQRTNLSCLYMFTGDSG